MVETGNFFRMQGMRVSACVSLFLFGDFQVVLSLQSDPLQIQASPLDVAPIPPEIPTVTDAGTVSFSGQEEPVTAEASGVQQATTTPSPYKTVPVSIEFQESPWTSALAGVKVDVTVDDEIDNQPDLRALLSWLRAQKASS